MVYDMSTKTLKKKKTWNINNDRVRVPAGGGGGWGGEWGIMP